jgi:glycosyltransferase involved in cell wall biosynthesis
MQKIAGVKQKYGIEGSYIFSAGTLEPRKNQKLLIDVFMESADYDLKDYTLVLSGAVGWKHSSILKKIRHASDRLVYTGRVDNEELRLLYRGASVFIYPSLYEGFGLPPLEAMASGCPVIASDTSSLSELLSGSALLVPPNDYDGLKSALLKLLHDNELQEELIKNGLACASRYNWENTATKMLHVYQSLSRDGSRQ